MLCMRLGLRRMVCCRGGCRVMADFILNFGRRYVNFLTLMLLSTMLRLKRNSNSSFPVSVASNRTVTHLCSRYLMCLHFVSLHLWMRLQFNLCNWLFDDNRNAFDIFAQMLIGFFHSRFECMASADLMDALNADFIRPAVCLVHLEGYECVNWMQSEADWFALHSPECGHIPSAFPKSFRQTAVACLSSPTNIRDIFYPTPLF